MMEESKFNTSFSIYDGQASQISAITEQSRVSLPY